MQFKVVNRKAVTLRDVGLVFGYYRKFTMKTRVDKIYLSFGE